MRNMRWLSDDAGWAHHAPKPAHMDEVGRALKDIVDFAPTSTSEDVLLCQSSVQHRNVKNKDQFLPSMSKDSLEWDDVEEKASSDSEDHSVPCLPSETMSLTSGKSRMGRTMSLKTSRAACGCNTADSIPDRWVLSASSQSRKGGSFSACGCADNPSRHCGCSCLPLEIEKLCSKLRDSGSSIECSAKLSRQETHGTSTRKASNLKGIHQQQKKSPLFYAESEEDKMEAEVETLEVQASVGRTGSGGSYCDVIGTVEFDSSSSFFATGGIARKVRVYNMSAVLLKGDDCMLGSEDEDDFEGGRQSSRQQKLGKRKLYGGIRGVRSSSLIDREKGASAVLCTPSKLSSLKWVPGSTNVIGCGDYDGVFAEWDIETGLVISEKDEQNGQRLWSVDYSQVSPKMSASASDDGTVKLWDAAMEKSFGEVKSPSGRAVCSVEFSLQSDRILAMGGADKGVYLFDLRRMGEPVLSLAGHSRTVSYVKFVGGGLLASASIDSTVRLWDMSSGREEGERQLAVLSAHKNERNFVGFAAKSGRKGNQGFLAAGSENNEVVVYGCRGSSTRMRTKVVLNLPFSTEGRQEPLHPNQRQSFVSAVCWGESAGKALLVAANSEGVVHILGNNI